MEDKAFELLEKMYGELISFKTDVNKRFNGVEKEIKELKETQRLTQSDVKELKETQRLTQSDVKELKETQRLTQSDVKELKENQKLIQTQFKEHGAILGSLKIAAEFNKADMDNVTHEVVKLSGEMKAEFKETNGKIDALSNDLTVVEAITGKNMTDIAHLKLIK
ncbi:hypothetical protein [Clostridium tagluense]|uniref:Uncharacterized protein n=1 Tax=Clostridium tagluense TaxID=360422 RepID=A0A401UHJ1_9CLOT|nr:hypothetical protein [Clostridium tagluense]GCD09020.1 hypothetical protein Ctaglu_06430 [Clostridium tagluense]